MKPSLQQNHLFPSINLSNHDSNDTNSKVARNILIRGHNMNVRQAEALLNISRPNSPDATREKGPISDFPTRSAVLRQAKN